VKRTLVVVLWILTLGTVVGAETGAAGGARITSYPDFPSRFVAPREVDVWLPPGYEANSGDRFPVIYLQNGQNLFDPAKSYSGTAWEIDRALERLIAAGRTRGAILVGIWNTGLTRSADYFPA
jgi:hypothetical protein